MTWLCFSAYLIAFRQLLCYVVRFGLIQCVIKKSTDDIPTCPSIWLFGRILICSSWYCSKFTYEVNSPALSPAHSFWIYTSFYLLPFVWVNLGPFTRNTELLLKDRSQSFFTRLGTCKMHTKLVCVCTHTCVWAHACVWRGEREGEWDAGPLRSDELETERAFSVPNPFWALLCPCVPWFTPASLESQSKWS